MTLKYSWTIVLLAMFFVSCEEAPRNEYVHQDPSVESLKCEVVVEQETTERLGTPLCTEDIVILNLEDGSRAFIADLLLKVDSCEPKVVVIDAFFSFQTYEQQDAQLEYALSKSNNLVLAVAEVRGELKHSLARFKQHSDNEAIVNFKGKTDQATHFFPVTRIEGQQVDHLGLKVLKYLKPEAKPYFVPNRSVTINFNYNLNDFHHINGSELNLLKHREELRNKIILIGYTGPTNEDKHSVPLNGYQGKEPNMYGIVIHANVIQQLLCDYVK